MRVNTLLRAAPPRARIAARPRHVRRVRIVADQLERIVGLDRGAEVEVTTGVQRPAAMIRLTRAQVDGDLVLERPVDLAQEVFEEDEFGRHSRIGFEFEHPVAIGVLHRLEAGAGLGDDLGHACLADLELPAKRGGPPGPGALFESGHAL